MDLQPPKKKERQAQAPTEIVHSVSAFPEGEREDHLALSVLRVGMGPIFEEQELETLSGYLKQGRDQGKSYLLVQGGEEYLERWLPNYAKEQRVVGHGLDWKMLSLSAVQMLMVTRLNARGLPAVGITGIDEGWMQADFLNIERLGRIGGPPKLDLDPLRRLLGNDVLPVVAPIGMASDGLPLSLRADMLAQLLAVAFDAQSLEFVTAQVPFQDREPAQLNSKSVASLIANNHLDSVIIPKLHASLAALKGGVERILLGDVDGISQGTATVISSC